MKRSLRGKTRRAISASMMAVALAAGGAAGAVPAEAAGSPPLTLEAARASVTFYRASADNGGGTYGDLGIYAVAGQKAFEVHAKRASYAKPIVATLLKPGKDSKLPTPKDFLGLTGFSTTTYTNQAGKVVHRSTTAFCPNTGEPVRRRPNAPSRSPYPDSCNGGPYSLGAVWGIQAGYAAPLSGGEDYYGDETVPDLPVGVYRATVRINPAYRKALGISTSRATATVKVTVKPEPACDDDDPRGCSMPLRTKAHPGRTAAAEPTRLTGKRIKPTGPLPDLRSLPAWGIGVERGRYLNFNATVWNAGPGRLVVDGFRTKKNPDLMKAYQYFFTSSGKQQGYAPVGGMEWDDRDGHSHWHFQDFAVYQLVDAKKKFVVRSAKEAFCLANTDSVNYLVKGANWRPDHTDLHTSCGSRESLGVREVLDTGSGDTYTQDLPGQSFDLRNLANGTYYIQIKANPDKVLHENKTSNNTSYRKVVVGGRPGARTVSVPQIGLIDESLYTEDDE